jgi:hypothetical protein
MTCRACRSSGECVVFLVLLACAGSAPTPAEGDGGDPASTTGGPHPACDAAAGACPGPGAGSEAGAPAGDASVPPGAGPDSGDASLAAEDASLDSSPGPPLEGGPYVTVTLSGCPLDYYYVPVTVGAQAFQMVFDTGSTDTAVATSSCTTCGVSPTYAPPRGPVRGRRESALAGPGQFQGVRHPGLLHGRGRVGRAHGRHRLRVRVRLRGEHARRNLRAERLRGPDRRPDGVADRRGAPADDTDVPRGRRRLVHAASARDGVLPG